MHGARIIVPLTASPSSLEHHADAAIYVELHVDDM